MPTPPLKTASASCQNSVPQRVFRGMMPILPTSILDNGELDLVSLRNLLRYAMACGAVSVGHVGGASEFYKLTMQDRATLIKETVAEINGRVPVFIGVTGASTRLATEFAKQAEDLGADLLMLATPYVTIPDAKGTCAYLEAVSNAVSIPIIMQDTAVSEQVLTPEVVVRLFNNIPNMKFFKADGRNFLAKSAGILELSNNEIEIIGGLGGRHMIHMLRMGITSFMTGTEATDIHGACVHAYLDGDDAKAAQIFYNQIMPYFAFYDNYPDELLKKMLNWRGIIRNSTVIPPEVPVRMTKPEWDMFEGILKKLDWRTDWSDVLEECFNEQVVTA